MFDFKLNFWVFEPNLFDLFLNGLIYFGENWGVIRNPFFSLIYFKQVFDLFLKKWMIFDLFLIYFSRHI